MVRYNTFRSRRYIRDRFIEGRFFLASEATDLELELIDSSRTVLKNSLGDVFLGSAFEILFQNSNQVSISPGEAWLNGLPFMLRSSKDELVSGSSYSLGFAPVGVSISDDTLTKGKLLNFTSGTTPSDTYRILLSATEEVITDSQVPFLRNENLTESTAQKVRIKYKINVVSDSLQTDSPIPYADENTSPSPVQNLNNQIQVTPITAGNGSVFAINNLTPSQVDGSTTEVIIRNDPAGLTNPLPKGANSDQQAYYNGSLIDSTGTEYHIVNITNTSISTANDAVRILIDKEFNQPNPQIIDGIPYYLKKRDLYYGDDSGNLLGKLYLPIAKIVWDSTSGITHSSKIVDLRNVIDDSSDFQEDTNLKFDYRTTGGFPNSFNISTQLASWSNPFTLINPHGPNMTIPTASAAILDGGSLVYAINPAGGSIARGSLMLTVNTTGSTVSVSSVDLSAIRVGNILSINNVQQVEIIGIDNVNKTLQVSPAATTTGSGFVYLDSFAPNSAPLDTETYILAVRNGNSVLFAQTVNIAPSVDVDSILTGTKTTATITDWSSVGIVTGPGFYSNNANISATWRRVGDTMEGNVLINFMGPPTSGDAIFQVPMGLSIDLNKLKPNFNNTDIVGEGLFQGTIGGQQAYLVVRVNNSSTLAILVLNTLSGPNPQSLNPSNVESLNPYAIVNGTTMEANFKIPILGWHANDTVNQEVLVNINGNVLTA